MKNSVVYLINQAGHDYSDAQRFGTLKPITVGNINILGPERDLFNMRNELKDFDSENDYLLLSGNSFIVLMTVFVVGEIHSPKSINTLTFHSKMKKYLHHRFYFDAADLRIELVVP